MEIEFVVKAFAKVWLESLTPWSATTLSISMMSQPTEEELEFANTTVNATV